MMKRGGKNKHKQKKYRGEYQTVYTPTFFYLTLPDYYFLITFLPFTT